MPAPVQEELPGEDSTSGVSKSSRPRAASGARSRTRSRTRKRPAARNNDSWASPSDLVYGSNDLESDAELDRVRSSSGDCGPTGPAYLDSTVMDREMWDKMVEVGLDGLTVDQKNEILKNMISSKRNRGRNSSRSEANDFELHEKRTMLSLKVILISIGSVAALVMLSLFVYFTLKNGLLSEEGMIGGLFEVIKEIIGVVNQS